MKSALPLSATKDNLRRLCVIRSLVLGGQIAAVLIAASWLQLALPYLMLSMVFLALALLTVLTWLRSNWSWPVTDPEFFGQLCIDIGGLTAVMYLAGGASNPFVFYYLVPLSIAAATLPRGYTLATATLCIVAYSALMFVYVPMEVLAPHTGHEHHDAAIDFHIVGMWINFLVSAALITFFVVAMASALRQREQVLIDHREERLRDEQLLAVATLAAGTAHELGTPLSTMRVLVEDLLEDHPADTALGGDLQVLERQLEHCQQQLARLVSTARQHSSGQQRVELLGSYFERLQEHWRIARPGIPLDTTLDATLASTLTIGVDATVEQAILNLLNNAADVSPKGVSLEISTDSQDLLIAILDDGPGIPVEQAESLGKPFVTSKGKGLGLGLFLSHATASRYGGSLTWLNREQGGSRVELRLPLQRIRPEFDAA